MRVVVTNVNRQHSYEAARAAADIGALTRFVTAIALTPTQQDRVRRLTAAAGSRRSAQLLGRTPDIPDGTLRTVPLPEVAEVAARPAARLLGLPAPTLTVLKCEWFDRAAARRLPPADVVLTFEQNGLHTMRAARRLGAVAALDQAILAWPTYEQRWRAACDRHGVTWRKPFPLYDLHVERKAKERATADYFVAGLDEVKQSLVAAGVAPTKVFTIPYGADLRLFRPPGDGDVREPSTGSLRLMFVGHQSWVKGLPDLLDALSLLADPRVELDVYGRSEPEWADVIRAKVDRLARQHVRVRVHGTVPQAELADRFRAADAFVFPSHIGGVGLSTLQALATGLPTIVSSADVLLHAGDECLEVAPDDPVAIADAVERLRADLDLRAHLRAGALVAGTAFDWTRYRRHLARAYEVMAAGGAAFDDARNRTEVTRRPR